jgi:hypothetical protein
MVMAPVITAISSDATTGKGLPATRNLNVAAHRSTPFAKLVQGLSKAAQHRDLLESERPMGCSASFIL